MKRTIAKNPVYKKIASKDGKRAAGKQLKADLGNPDGKVRKRWKEEIEETIHLRAGGRQRINNSEVNVVKVNEHSHDLIDRSLKFYTVKKYKEKFGDPKATKAKIVTRMLRGGKKMSGIYVRQGEEGIYDVEDVHC